LNNKEQIWELEEEIKDIKASWPAHTPSPALAVRLEELEDKLK
jgi:hypothetical protein